MITSLFPERPSLFREARLAHFAGAPGAEAPKNEPEVTLDTKMKLETSDAIGRAKDVRIKAAEDATHDIDATMGDRLAKIASLELTELTKEKKNPEDIKNAAQTIQDRFAHAGILATPVIDPATNAVTWTFETLSITASDIPGADTMDKTVLDPLLQQLNGLESGMELVVKELLKSDPDAAGKLTKFGDPSVRKGAEVAMDLVDWKDPDASIGKITDADTKSAVEALRTAVGDDDFLVKMQETYRRVEGQSAPTSSASESGVQLTPEQQKKLDASLNTNISKMKDYEVMRVQGQIMMDFGVNVVVEGEGDARKLKAEPVDEKSQKFTKFMGLIMVAGSYIAQLMELKNRIEGKSTGDGKEKSADAAPAPEPAPGDQPPVEQPGETPDATALKKGEEKLVAAGAKKEEGVHVLDLKHSADPKFSFQEGRWKVAFNDDPAMDVAGLSYNENEGSEESKKETVILNALLKELADVNKEAADRTTDKAKNKDVADDTEKKIDKLVSPKVEAEMTKLSMKLPDSLVTAKEDVKALRKMLEDNKTGDAVDQLADKVKQHGERVDVIKAEIMKQMGDKYVDTLKSTYSVSTTPEGYDFNLSSFYNVLAGTMYNDPDIAIRFDSGENAWQWKFTGSTSATEYKTAGGADTLPTNTYDEPVAIVKRLGEINGLFN